MHAQNQLTLALCSNTKKRKKIEVEHIIGHVQNMLRYVRDYNARDVNLRGNTP